MAMRSLSVSLCLVFASAAFGADPVPLAGTAPMVMEGDIASQLVDGVDRFVMKEMEQADDLRNKGRKEATSNGDVWRKRIEAKRQKLAKMLGVIDKRHPPTGFEFVASTEKPSLVLKTDKYEVRRVRWPVLRQVTGEGLLLEPVGSKPVGSVVVLPGVAMTPEMVAGVIDFARPCDQYARRLAEEGFRVVVPVLINRDTSLSTTANGTIHTGLTNREFLYRPAFELGRHLLGYETQKVIAAVEILNHEKRQGDSKIGVLGFGDGGLIATYATALCENIDACVTGTCFGGGDRLWQQPLDRNVFGIWREFGEVELADLILPRGYAVETGLVLSFITKPGGRGGPTTGPWIPSRPVALRDAILPTVPRMIDNASPAGSNNPETFLNERLLMINGWSEAEPPAASAIYVPFKNDPLPALGKLIGVELEAEKTDHPLPTAAPPGDEPIVDQARMQRQFEEIVRDAQYVLEESPYTRVDFWAKAKPAREERRVERWVALSKEYRGIFRHDMIGHFDNPKKSPQPRTRQVYDEPGYTGYEVVLDVFDDVIAYGILLVPKGIKEGERRPVVVTQHGLEGRPQDVADPKINNPAYNQYGCRLAERGFVVFAPQNLYIFTDRFRVLQRKLNPLGKTLFSIIVPQHEQIVDWLSTLAFVDDKRIGFYGLSYGGKSAMRIPALVEKYALSICSADFNDWIWKNASTRSPYSYVSSGEYEIFEFGLGPTFNYAEMAGLICPRPFMVERGHRDGVGPDDRVASEFAKVRLLYADLQIPGRAELEVFDGPHTIHGVGTFEFLHKHLAWPSPGEPKPLNNP